ncbi:amino acid/amide ABC transporter substrate-binding protein, HAAT family (TC 3.A.1.4.-) [Enhydrobacter aerosaccus]|uniref:Amino acid/amide ABC transporter substrate-binding protein, HAAT family (TC 3.A.1.4.-) n=1 Tax=Enhydrobacter aerosaccus TaxID=225324 RepID=A0A1T4RHX8_9HYPH|nr:ABC transporter substrate-binding protein [Enhydrobacter aerosaccus]SKA15529.1 amino acid/amide ABC transporter substrate-binding protein, HAAT family (TC 3.A.1.4.-) [Enhydrobacter aerosaccus]
MRNPFSIASSLSAAALALVALPALADEPKVTNQGVTPTEIVLGTHQDLSGPIKSWGVPVTNGMKLAVEEINAAGGINGRKIKLIVEDSGYDPKRAVLASQKLVEKDKIFAMLAPMGSPTVLAAQDILLDAGVPQLFPVTSAAFTYQMDPKKPQERLKFNNVPPYTESVRAGARYLMQDKGLKKPCIMYQDDEFGKNVLDGFNQAVADVKLTPAAVTSYKRGASDFSSQVAKMKADGCDFVVLGTIVRETVGAMSEAKKIGFAPIFFGSTAANVVEVPELGKEVAEGFYAVGGMEIPYRDTATGKAKDWAEAYYKTYKMEPNTQSALGYDEVMMFAHYAKLAGKDLTGAKFLAAMESGDVFKDIFGMPPAKFSKTDHLSANVYLLQQVKNGRWVVLKSDLKN